MILTFEEYKEKICEAERYEFAKRVALSFDSEQTKKLFNIHNAIEFLLKDNRFLLLMYNDYCREKGIRFDS